MEFCIRKTLTINKILNFVLFIILRRLRIFYHVIGLSTYLIKVMRFSLKYFASGNLFFSLICKKSFFGRVKREKRVTKAQTLVYTNPTGCRQNKEPVVSQRSIEMGSSSKDLLRFEHNKSSSSPLGN